MERFYGPGDIATIELPLRRTLVLKEFYSAMSHKDAKPQKLTEALDSLWET